MFVRFLPTVQGCFQGLHHHRHHHRHHQPYLHHPNQSHPFPLFLCNNSDGQIILQNSVLCLLQWISAYFGHTWLSSLLGNSEVRC